MWHSPSHNLCSGDHTLPCIPARLWFLFYFYVGTLKLLPTEAEDQQLKQVAHIAHAEEVQVFSRGIVVPSGKC